MIKVTIDILFLFLLGLLAFPEALPSENYETFVQMNLTVLVYAGLRGAYYFYLHRSNWIINPLFTSLIIVFGLNCGVLSNFLFLQDGQFLISTYELGLDSDMYWYKIAMFNIGLALVGMFMGNSSIVGYWLHGVTKQLISRMLTFTGINENLQLSGSRAVWVIGSISVIRLWQIVQGTYGRLVSRTVLESDFYRATIQYFNILNGASIFALFVVAYLFFTNKIGRPIFLAALGVELFWGFLAGARGTFLAPIAVVAAASYFAVGKLRFSQALPFLVGLFIAMTVVIPFKNFYSRYGADIDLTSISNIITRFYDYYLTEENLLEEAVSSKETSITDQDSTLPWYYTLFYHVNYSTEVAASIRYNDLYGLPSDSPDFLGDIVLGPVYAVVPRILWPSKPVHTHGLWFRENILNYQVSADNTTSIAMTAISYLYFTGGSLAVFVGFLFVGAVQKSFFLFLGRKNGLIGLVVFLIMMGSFYYVDSVFHAITVNYLRNIFISIFILLIFCKKNRPVPALSTPTMAKLY